MVLEAVHVKRVRRAWEPEDKPWADTALESPWEDIDPPLHKATIFSLKNVFFFSHATAVQVKAVPLLRTSGQSALVEAPTGSGKTLAFLIPLMERTVWACERYLAEHQRPPLTRHIIGVIFSPSSTLAEQTYLVARNLAARFPFNIQFVLCDGVGQSPDEALHHLQRGSRGAGSFLVTTPRSFKLLMGLLFTPVSLSCLDATTASDEADCQSSLCTPHVRRRRARGAGRRLTPSTRRGCVLGSNDNQVCFSTVAGQRFVVVVDEADLVFASAEMRAVVMGFVEEHCCTDACVTPTQQPPRSSKHKDGQKKTDEVAQATLSLRSDLIFVGATVSTSSALVKYAETICRRCGTVLHSIISQSQQDFLSQLQSRYVLCEAHDFLPSLIHVINLHASKKHFVFFNHPAPLLFVQALLRQLSVGARPLLYIKDIYVMHEEMRDGARMEQYNSFLTHKSTHDGHSTPTTGGTRRRRRRTESGGDAVGAANQVYLGGWKHGGTPPMGTGAILLCTDIAAFGLDVRDVQYVYHFEPPSSVQSYIHRIGRVGRMGMRGVSMLLLPCTATSSAADASAASQTGQARGLKNPSHQTEAVVERGGSGGCSNRRSGHGTQCVRPSADQLPRPQYRYLRELARHNGMEEYVLPPSAPIAATVRNIVAADTHLLKLARAAAMSMCAVATGSSPVSWFTPYLALRALLLD